MVRGFSLGCLVFCLVSIASTAAQAKPVCGKDTVDTFTYDWCFEKGEGQRANDILYYFHGLNEDAKSWIDGPVPLEIKRQWKSMGIERPSVAAISLGPLWVLSSVKKGTPNTLYETFVKKIMAKLEAKATKKVRARMLVGGSMGGFNASQLLFRNSELFTRVAFLCPAIPTVGPYSSKEEVDAYFVRNPYANKELIQALLDWSRGEFPTAPDWLAHDPLEHAKNLSAKSPELFVACGDRDQFGFFEGVERYATSAFLRGTAVQWMPILQGGHCDLTPEVVTQLARFLSGPRHLNEDVEVHEEKLTPQNETLVPSSLAYAK
jgi:pimeloyl-ACP methyl ester carboxylesterase